MDLSVTQRLSFKVAGMARRRAMRLDDRPVLSIGFDDAPRSAWTVGQSVLDQHDVKATYYVCGQLMGTRGELGAYLEPEDVGALAAAGHEVGCHTFDHSSALTGDFAHFARSVHDNADCLSAKSLPQAPLRSFAYPYCHVGIASRRFVGQRFTTARAGGRRWNGARFDPAVLAGWPLEAREGEVDYDALCAATVRDRGWLVMFSHDVDEQPTPYGCTPGQLERLIRAARRAGMAIAPVGDVALTSA